MGKKKGKGRSVKRNQNVTQEPEELIQAPHSFVIHKGVPGGHILELTKDFRKVMEPFTASSLKVICIVHKISNKSLMIQRFRNEREIQLKILCQ